MMETTRAKWHEIAELVVDRVNKWIDDDSTLPHPTSVSRRIMAVNRRLTTMMILAQSDNILRGGIDLLCVEQFFAPIATAVVRGFITPEEVRQYIAPEDYEFMELALFRELDKTSNDITNPNWKPLNGEGHEVA